MRQRLMSGWNARRFIYLLIGILILMQGMLMKEWIGILGGAYFGTMGFFGWGCASGNCGVDRLTVRRNRNERQQETVDYEEVK